MPSRDGTATEYRAENFRTFDTICSATQDRQDAVQELLRESLDAMVVIGGYNSSNTISLAALCAERVPTYHIEDATSIEPETRRIIFRPAGRQTQRGLGGRLDSRSVPASASDSRPAPARLTTR